MKKAIIFGLILLFLVGFVSAFEINSYSPVDLNVVMNEGSNQEFNLVILTTSNEDLIYNWELYKNDGQIIAPSNIIFTRDEKEIFSINPDGTNLKQLTLRPSDSSWNDGGAIYDEYPSLTKNGKIVFARKDGDTAFHGAYQIWSMNLDGSGQIKLTGWFTESIPPNADYTGKLISAISLSDFNIYYNLGAKIWKMNIDGTNEEIVFPVYPFGNSTESCSQIKVSLDGTKIVCINKDNMVEVINIDGTNEMVLTTKDYISDYTVPSLKPYTSPGWNYDGTRITFVIENTKLWSMNLDGSG
ncbi:MAG: DUF5050 domain-containing protein, partial [Nanoarchaeota archaeon]|nr:DUF5050 domain-containing protein [Nanoarchaeota archaeon]